MTDDELGVELSNTLDAVAAAYEPGETAFSTTESVRRPERRQAALLMLSAAALGRIVGITFALTSGNNDTAELDIRDTETSAPTTSLANDDAPETTQGTPQEEPAESVTAPALDGWTWEVGAAAPGHVMSASAIWIGHEVAFFDAVNGHTDEEHGFAYNPTSDSWRELSRADRSSAIVARDDITGPANPTELDGLLEGRVSDNNGADPGRWIYSGFPDKSVELPAQTLNAFLVGDALAVWAGDELIVWDGSSCVTDACDEFGVLTPFILRPQAPDAAAPQPVDPSGSWIVDEVEVDWEIAVDELSRGQTPALMIMNLEGAFEELDGVDTWIGSVVGFAGCEFSIALTHSPDGTSLGWGVDRPEASTCATSSQGRVQQPCVSA